jgi:hypothetical protein
MKKKLYLELIFGAYLILHFLQKYKNKYYNFAEYYLNRGKRLKWQMQIFEKNIFFKILLHQIKVTVFERKFI